MKINYIKASLLSALLSVPAASWADSRLTVGDLTLRAGEEQTVQVILDNDETLSTFQFYLDVPQGLEIVSMPEATDRVPTAKGDWQAFWSNTSRTRIKVLFLADNPELRSSWIKGNSGAVASFVVKAGTDYIGQELTMKVYGIRLTDTADNEISQKDLDVNITVEAGDIVPTSADMSLSTDKSAAPTGEVIPVTFALDNNVSCSALIFNLVASEGASLVLDEDDLPQFDITSRVADRRHVQRTLLADGKYSIALINQSTNVGLKGNEGDFITFYFRIDEGYTGEGVTLSAEDVQMGHNKTLYDGNGCSLYIRNLGSSDVPEGPVRVQITGSRVPTAVLPGVMVPIGLVMDNSVGCSSLIFHIAPSEGVRLATDDDGQLQYRLGDRSDANTKVTMSRRADGSYDVMLTNRATNIAVTGNDGEFITFYATLSESHAATTASVAIDAVEMGYKDGLTKFGGQGCTITFGNQLAIEAARVAANNTACHHDKTACHELQTALDRAQLSITLNYPAYADASAAAEVQATIDALFAAADAALAAVEKEGEYEHISIDSEAITAAINALVDNARAKKEEADAKEAARVAANNAAHAEDIATIEALQTALDNANAEITANYAEYADEDAANAVQATINALTATANAALTAVETAGVYEHVNIDNDAITAAIDALMNDARAKKEADEAAKEAARVAANQAAHAEDIAAIASLQTALDNANATIAEHYAEYADEEAANEVKSTIDALTTAANAALAAVETAGVYEHVNIDNDAITAAIDALMNDARAKKEADEAAREAARVAANNAAHAEDIATIAALQTALNEANADITAHYAEYADEEAAAEVQATIEALTVAANAALDAVQAEGNYEHIAIDNDAITAVINALVTEARQKKEQAEADEAAKEAARVAANNAAHAEDLAAIAALQAALDNANATIAEHYAEYADEEAATEVQATIDALTVAANAALAAVESAGEYEHIAIDNDAITTAINALVTEARQKKEQAEADEAAKEAARVAANNAAHAEDIAAIASLQTALDNANATIAEHYAEYADEEAANEVQSTIDALTTAANAAIAAVETEGTYEHITIDSEAINAAIDALVTNARTKKEEAEADEAAKEAARVAANQAAHAEDIAAIASLQTALGNANADIAENYAEYADEEAATEVQATIDALTVAANAALAAVETVGEYEHIAIDNDAITTAINALVTEARQKKEQAEADEAAKEAARVAANQAAHANDVAAIATLQTALNNANAEIAESYAEYADEDAAYAVQTTIDALTVAANAALSAVETEGYYEHISIDNESINSAINALVTEARQKKEQTEADEAAKEAARVAANQAAYANDVAAIAALQTALNNANAEIAESYAEYADEEAANEVQSTIDALTTAANAAIAAVETAGEYEHIEIDNDAITTAINALVDNARAKKEEAEADEAAKEAARVAANKTAHAEDVATITALQAALDEANAEITTHYAEYADEDAANAVQTTIDALTVAANSALAAVETAGEYEHISIDRESINAAINALVTEAKAKKEQAEADEAAKEAARVAANQAAHAEDIAAIASLQTALDNANTTIAEHYAEYADEDAANAVKSTIDALTVAANAAIAAVETEGTYEHITIDSEAINAAIDALVTNARTKKEEAEADEAAKETARVEANNAAHAEDIATIEALQTALDNTNADIAENYTEYADEETASEIQATIDALTSAADAALVAVEAAGEYEHVSIDSESITSAINALVDNARAKKEADEAAKEAARVAANQAAHAEDVATIAVLQAALDAANADIAEHYTEYADEEAADAVQATLDALISAADAALSAVEAEGSYEHVSIDNEGINAAIDALVDEARAKKEEAEAAKEAARVAANSAAHAEDLADIAALQAALDEANADIATNYAEYADEEEAGAVQEAIDALATAADAALEAVQEAGLYEHISIDSEGLTAAIDALVADAKARKEAADGVLSPTAIASGAKKVYGLGGELLHSLRKGINIVVGRDGKTRKLLK